MTLALDEFLRRFLLHTLPKGFVRIRHFGFLANRRRATLLPLCYRLLDAEQPRNPNQKRPQPSNRIHFGAVPNVAATWWSSKD